jgi:hypothetical protein
VDDADDDDDATKGGEVSMHAAITCICLRYCEWVLRCDAMRAGTLRRHPCGD